MARKKRRLTALLLCACLLLVFSLSGALVSSHAEHECNGSHCEVCAQISHIGDLLRQLKAVLLFIAAVLSCGFYLRRPIPLPEERAVLQTPVKLRVQMNN